MTDTSLPPAATEPPVPVPPPVESSLPDLLNNLTHSDAATRLETIQQLGRLTTADKSALRALEKAAAQDDDPGVRDAALLALAAPAYRTLQQQDSRLSLPLRCSILAEIERWSADGLLPTHLAGLLQQRYNFDQLGPVSTPAPAPVPAGPRPTLTQVLLSETTIKVALYLGAFFVVAAAFILAAIFDILRLPILGLATVGFLGAALALKRRLPTASFVLFTVFSFLLPIDAAVLVDMIDPGETLTWLYWITVAGFFTLVWGGGTFLYQSRLFSLLALAAGSLAMLLIGRWLDRSPHLDLLLLELPLLAALGATVMLTRWKDRRFSLPLFILAQLQQIVLLGLSGILVLVALVDQDLPQPVWWLVIAFTWLLAALFYAASQRLTAFVLFPPLAVAALAPVPLFFSGVFSPTWQAVMIVAWVWGTILAMGGEGLSRIRRPSLSLYSLWLVIGSAGLYLLAAVGGLAEQVAFGIGYLVGTAAVYLALTMVRPRAWLWSASLVAATGAYLAVFLLRRLEIYDFYPGFILLWPALAWLSLSLAMRRAFNAHPRWHLPPLVLGGLIGAFALSILLTTGSDEPGRAAVGLLIIAGFVALFSLIDRQPLIGYGATAGLALALGFGLIWGEQEQWVLPLVGLAALYYLSGLAGIWLGRLGRWAGVLRLSGLGLGTLVALSGPIQGGAGGVIGPALVATFFAVEAFRLRQVWLGLPANLLYLVAYFTLLLELDVEQPQFYSIGAALLGFVMHYFLTRSGSKWAAFLTGLLSQFILLGTSYVQMFSTEKILYFFVLFAQAIVVLVYGLVIRSRSLVLAPIVFVVLGVITVALSVLAGIPALILVGCTGLLLLLLGIAALVMREKILIVTNRLGERFSGWQA
ncbi:MAG: HEAT repeat domain-containing protein [Anaerolineae bacterium]|nr:HEAT repeat domain-containing protein [Anaerolineae bacterium]